MMICWMGSKKIAKYYLLKGAEIHDFLWDDLKTYIYKNETNKWETQFSWLATQRMYTNGRREYETSVDREIEGRMPNTTLLTLTFYEEFDPIKFLNNENV